MQEVLVVKTAEQPNDLDGAIRAALGEKTTGVSTGPYGIRAHLTDAAGAADITLATNVLNGHDSLTVNTDKATITADGSDTATITCSDAAIASDPDADYAVWLDGNLYAQGSENLVGGVVTLTLKTSIIGVFQIEIRRKTGDFASGYVTVTAEAES